MRNHYKEVYTKKSSDSAESDDFLLYGITRSKLGFD